MASSLKLTLDLEKKECIRGESVFFTVGIVNDSNAPVPNFPPPLPELQTVKLVLEGPAGRREAGQLTPEERQGEHRHGPRTPGPKVTLAPKQRLEVKGDLLQWFGELEPGDYTLHAEHISLLEEESPPAKLKVQAAKPVVATVPRATVQGPATPLPAVWGHKQADGVHVFHQQLAAGLPRSPVHCFRAGVAPEGAVPVASITGNSDVTTGHVYWIEKEKNIPFVPIDLATGKAGKPGKVALSFPGELIHSGLSMPQGTLWLPVTGKDRAAVTVLRIGGDGKMDEFVLDLGRAKPMGPNLCLWEHGRRLQFAWSPENGREVQLARLTLVDPAKGFVTKTIFTPDDPVFWLDAFIDIDAPAREAPYFEEQVKPDDRDKPVVPVEPPLMIVTVTQTAAALHIFHVNSTNNLSKRVTLIPLGSISEPRCLGGLVTYELQTVMLLADAKDDLFIASTTDHKVRPVSEIAKSAITLKNDPALISASRQGRSPWVYLRYFDNDAIQYARVEPADELDPIETHERPAMARAGRRR